HHVALEPFALAWNLPAEDLSVLHEIVAFQDLGGHAVAPSRAAEWTGMLAEALFAALVAAAVAGGTIRLDGPWICLQGHKVALSPADQKLQARIEPLLAADRYDPPRVRDIAGRLSLREEEVRRLMRRLARMGRLVEVAPDHFYPRPVVAEMAGMVGTIAAATPGGQITAAQFRDRIGTGRKLAILILEFFDRMGVTLRQGDLRRPRPEKRDLFGAGPA
ncbi:MAG: SelB domain-containing protein, partial [Ferrovibrionaceae bacterium]